MSPRMPVRLWPTRPKSVTSTTTKSFNWEVKGLDRKSTRLNSSHLVISYAVFCLKKKIAFQHEDGHAGILYGGGFELLIAQVLACLVAIVFAGVARIGISLVLRRTRGERIDRREE